MCVKVFLKNYIKVKISSIGDFMKKLLSILGLVLLTGCSSENIPQAHKGRMFGKTGAFFLYSGVTGFYGPILEPGTHYTGLYDEIMMVECAQQIRKVELNAMTKDGVTFKVEVAIRYSTNCDDPKAVHHILNKMTPGFANDEKHPEWKHVIFAVQLFDSIIMPSLLESLRKSVSTYIANDINANRDKIFTQFHESFFTSLKEDKLKLVEVLELNLSNLDFPEQLDNANIARAEQAVLKDKAIAEREKVQAEVETTNMRKNLAESESNNEVVRIDALGAAYRRNPEYVQLEAIKAAAEKGNLIIANPGTPIILQKK